MRPIALHTITQKDAAHVLWVMGYRKESSVEPGSFTAKLIEAMALADPSNLERLERGFEGLVSAVRAYKELPNGLALLTGLAQPATPF